MKQVQNCSEDTLKCYTFENVTSVLAVVYVLLGSAVTEYRWGGNGTLTFMRHEFLVLSGKKWLKLMYIYRSYGKNKTGVSLFWTTLYIIPKLYHYICLPFCHLSHALTTLYQHGHHVDCSLISIIFIYLFIYHNRRTRGTHKKKKIIKTQNQN